MRKISIVQGDLAAAGRAAQYPLEKGDQPQAYGRGDYWTAKDEAASGSYPMWVGEAGALDALGVEAGQEATGAALSRALMGRHTQTGERVRRAGPTKVEVLDEHGQPVLGRDGEPLMRKAAAVTSIDLTLSAPKSWSIAWSQASPELRVLMERATKIAAKAAVDHMVQTKDVVYWGPRSGIREPAKGAVMVQALHVTARRAEDEQVPSPQLHVHNVVVGVLRSDGKLVTPQSFALFTGDAPLEGGAVFRAALADQALQLGFEVRAGTGRNGRFFEIEGVPEPMMERLSGRTRDVLRAIREEERETGVKVTGAALGGVAARTRQAKDKQQSPEAIAAAWRAIGEEFGFRSEQVEALRSGSGYAFGIEERKQLAREALEERMSLRGPTVSLGEARAIVFEVAPGRLTPAEAYAWLEELERSGELIALEGSRATTVKIRALEEQVMRIAAKAAGSSAGGLSAAAVEAGRVAAEAGIGGGHRLDGEQLEAVAKLTAGSGWSVLTGLAGTGKGPTLEAVAVAHRHDGWDVVACAVDGSTAQRLGFQVGAQALSLDQVRYRLEQGTLQLGERTLLLIDEASKVGLARWGDIASWVERHGVRVLAVGHEGQLGAIELPGLFTAMRFSEQLTVAELKEVRRHRDPDDPGKIHPWLRDYQVALDAGNAEHAVGLLRKHGALSFQDDVLGSMRAMVADWDVWRHQHGVMESKLIVHGSNNDVNALNVLAQQRRLAAGELGGEGIAAVDRDYRIHTGDVVVLANGSYQPERVDGEPRARRVENGQVGVVTAVDVAGGAVNVRIREAGHAERVVRFDMALLRARLARGGKDGERVGSLRLGYASHSFPLQGATVRGTAVLAGHESQGKEATYVGDTRGVYEHRVYIPREYLGMGNTDEERVKLYIERVKISQHRQASIRTRLDASGRIATLVPRGAPVPGTAARDARLLDPERELDPELEPVALADPFDAQRGWLGPRRAELVARHAEQLAGELETLDVAALRRRAEEIGRPFDLLDPQQAATTLTLERECGAIDKRRQHDLAEAAQFRERAEALGSGRRRRALREEAEEAAELHERRAASESVALTTAQERLAAEGGHLDAWMAEHGERAAQWVAVQRELTLREGLQIAAQVERVVEQPSEHVRELLGERPAEPERRNEWDGLARELERGRLVNQRPDRRDAAQTTRERYEASKRNQRVEQFREQRGLPPLEQQTL
ncbi:MAG TPA: MobF family relaxase, partial [Conexibacter sp.]|nr:MobF family relaxase [Conexibacter sp.]